MVLASALRALLASGLLGKPRLAPQAVARGVWNGFVASPGTAVKGGRIRRRKEVPPGGFLAHLQPRLNPAITVMRTISSYPWRASSPVEWPRRSSPT